MNGQQAAVLTSPPASNARGLVVRVVDSTPISVAITSLPDVTGSTRSAVADNAADTLLLSADVTRKVWSCFNDSTATLYIALGTAAASTTSYTAQVLSGGYYEPPPGFDWTAEVRGIWASAPGTGAARLTQHF